MNVLCGVIMKPFEKKELFSQTKIQHFMKNQPKENAIIEIRNKLSDSKLKELSLGFISEVERKYKVMNSQEFIKEKKNILDEFINYRFAENDIKKINYEDFQVLSNFLGIKEQELEALFCKYSGEKFITEVEKIIRKILDSKSKIQEYQNELSMIQNVLKITDEDFKDILDTKRYDIVNDIFQKALDGGQYSPNEEAELNDISERLQVTLVFNEETKNIIRKSKKMWEIENSPLSIIETDINLYKDEVCYYSTVIDYFEYKSITRRIGYSGPTFRLKILKGFYYRAGRLNVQRETKDVLTKIDTGDVYITNKRVLFIGKNRTYNIRLNKILDIELFSDGVKIIKDAGRNIFLGYRDEIELFALVLARVIKDYQQ